MARKLQLTCGTCGGRYRNPFAHTCAARSDFKRRVSAEARAITTAERREKSAAARAKETAARRSRRAREETARKARRAREEEARKNRTGSRARKNAPAKRTHPRPSACRDKDCERPACLAYRDGFEDGARSAGDQS